MKGKKNNTGSQGKQKRKVEINSDSATDSGDNSDDDIYKSILKALNPNEKVICNTVYNNLEKYRKGKTKTEERKKLVTYIRREATIGTFRLSVSMKAQDQLKRVIKLVQTIKKHKEYKFLFILDNKYWNDNTLKTYISTRHRDRLFNIKKNQEKINE